MPEPWSDPDDVEDEGAAAADAEGAEAGGEAPQESEGTPVEGTPLRPTGRTQRRGRPGETTWSGSGDPGDTNLDNPPPEEEEAAAETDVEPASEGEPGAGEWDTSEFTGAPTEQYETPTVEFQSAQTEEGPAPDEAPAAEEGPTPDEAPAAEEGAAEPALAVSLPADGTGRACAALELRRDRLRYLELEVHAGGSRVTRYEEVALLTVPGATFEDYAQNVTVGLTELRQRLGPRVPTCTLLLEPEPTMLSVLLLPPIRPDQVDGAVQREVVSHIPLEESLYDSRVLGDVQLGPTPKKAVLVVYTQKIRVESQLSLLEAAGFLVGRVTSSHVAFLETIAPLAAKRGRDIVEAVVYIDSPVVTIGMIKRGVLVYSRTFRLGDYDRMGDPETVQQLKVQLKRTALYFQRLAGGGEIARVHYLSAIPESQPFPADALAMGDIDRPPSMLDVEELLRIDPESVERLSVPTDALATLAPPAMGPLLVPAGARAKSAGLRALFSPSLGAAARTTDAINLVPESYKIRAVKTLAWALNVVAAAVLAFVLLVADRLEASAINPYLAAIDENERKLTVAAGVIHEYDELRALRDRVERDRFLVDRLIGTQIDLRPLLLELANLKPKDLYLERVRVYRTQELEDTLSRQNGGKSGTSPWLLELAGLAVTEKGGAGEIANTFTDGLRKTKSIEYILQVKVRSERRSSGSGRTGENGSGGELVDLTPGENRPRAELFSEVDECPFEVTATLRIAPREKAGSP